jgi:hypothetical protein
LICLRFVIYADDGFIGGYNHVAVKHTLDSFVKSFRRFGLNMNGNKTKTMTMLGSKPVHQILDDAYNQRITKIGLTCQEKQQAIKQCQFCNNNVQTKSIQQHHLSKQCQEAKKKLPIGQKIETYCSPTTPTLLEESHTTVLSMDEKFNTNCPHEICHTKPTKGNVCKDIFARVTPTTSS